MRVQILTTICIIIFTFSSCLVWKFVRYNYSDITDYKIFPYRTIAKQEPVFHFTDKTPHDNLTDTLQINDLYGNFYTLNEFLATTPTVAFLIIRNDTILYEKYFNSYENSSVVASFSMAKSFVSALTGIAIEEGYIKNENQSVTDFVTELKGTDISKITIKHLLQMTSGIKYTERYNDPFSDVSRHYYGKNMRKILNNIKLQHEPGLIHRYKSIDSQLLGLVLEKATGKTLSEYLQEKIWKPLGMQYDATWSLDIEDNGIEKAYCCLNARAIDFAKFGRLYLNKGNWNGVQIIPSQWVDKSTMVDTTGNKPWFYQYNWWLVSRIYGDYWANGHHGQYVYVYPSKNIIIVRLGLREGKQHWGNIFRQLTRKL